MQVQSGILFKALAQIYSAGSAEGLLKYLPKQQSAFISSLPEVHESSMATLFSPQKALHKIHYSWLKEILLEQAPKLVPLLLAVLNEEQQQGIRRLSEKPLSSVAIAPVTLQFAASYLKKLSIPEDVQSEELLVPSEMNILLALPKPTLTHLIQLLGIYDLAADLRQVVDRTLIEKIQGALSKEQLLFLNYCSKQAMKWIPPRLHLTAWNGDAKVLQRLLLERGLFRMAKSLYNEDKSLIWHVCHRLDTGRGRAILKMINEKPLPPMTTYFQAQVIHLAKRYHK